jgi:hypothetical protein
MWFSRPVRNISKSFLNSAKKSAMGEFSEKVEDMKSQHDSAVITIPRLWREKS